MDVLYFSSSLPLPGFCMLWATPRKWGGNFELSRSFETLNRKFSSWKEKHVKKTARLTKRFVHKEVLSGIAQCSTLELLPKSKMHTVPCNFWGVKRWAATLPTTLTSEMVVHCFWCHGTVRTVSFWSFTLLGVWGWEWCRGDIGRSVRKKKKKDGSYVETLNPNYKFINVGAWGDWA